jgi:hypothetical protein
MAVVFVGWSPFAGNAPRSGVQNQFVVTGKICPWP